MGGERATLAIGLNQGIGKMASQNRGGAMKRFFMGKQPLEVIRFIFMRLTQFLNLRNIDVVKINVLCCVYSWYEKQR